MNRIHSLVRASAAVLLAFLLVCPSYAGASDSDILERLQRMEQEINKLKQENAELRREIKKDREQETKENQWVQEMVKKDRKDIQELKRSAGRIGESGMKAVLGKFNMELYGRVKVDLNYDTADFGAYSDGDWLGAVSVGDAENDSTNFNPRDTRFGLKVSRRDGPWLSQARLEMDFYGTNAGNNLIPRLRLGYIKITNEDWDASLLIGQDWIPVAQLNAPTIDFGIMASAGNLWWRVPQVTLRKNIGNFEFLLSAMRHRRRLSVEQETRPWALARIAYENGLLGRGGLLAVSGGVCNTEVDNGYGRDNDVDRWMLALELRLKFGKFTFLAEPWIGEGLDREWLRYDMGINPYDNHLRHRNRRPDTIRGRGGFAALAYQMNPKLKFACGYGIDDPNKSDMEGMEGFLNDRQFTKNEMYFFNTWYSLTNAVKVGVEIMYLETERFDDTNNGMRYTFSTAYYF